VSIGSLIAEGSAWSGVDGTWVPAGRGLTYAAEALRSAEGVLGGLNLSVKPVTLAGPSGNVPVTVVNTTDRTLRVTLQATPGRSVRIEGPSSLSLTLKPGERFTEIPVELVNVLSGDLHLSLKADTVELATTTVRLRASYLDRLAVVGGILVLLAGLLVFIIRRVRAAESGDSPAHSGSRR
jgi:hypothetical protein